MHEGGGDDSNPLETREWLDSLEYVLDHEGTDRANFLLERLSSRMTQTGARLPYTITTPYRNTIPANREAFMPGDLFMERRIRSLVRWNALAMVIRANRADGDLGGHISTFASSATLYDVGFNYFFRGPTDEHAGDLIYFQGHSAPGIYARSFLEGRLSENQLDGFRQEVDGAGLSSYPHPWLMPDYWQFPTVSMGLGPIQAIYQAHIMKYLDSRGLIPMDDRKVWAFLGDGECDEPESLGALAMAGRERLDNLIFVVNCNLQRLDGPVRGNAKIIQELEGEFRGSGWNVIKVVWGRLWDPLFTNDVDGLMQQRMNETVDGEYQNYKAKGGGYTRKEFFGTRPELLKLVENLSDDDIMRLNRGGHDPFKVYAAYHAAVHHSGEPTVILAKTVKGYGMGDAGEAENNTHQVKKLDLDGLRHFRDRFDIPLSDADLEGVPYYRPPDDSPEMIYMRRQREKLGGPLPKRVAASGGFEVPGLEVLSAQLEGSGEREISTTMAFVRILATLLRDKSMGDKIVPIIPDEAGPSGWRECSGSWVSTLRKGSFTNRSTRGSSRRIASRVMARCLRKASTRRVRSRPGLRLPRPTAPINMRWSPFTSSIRCSVFSASATWRGRPRTCRLAGFCWERPQVARPSTAKGCSIRTGTATCSPRPYPTASPTTPALPTSWPSLFTTACGGCSWRTSASTTTSRS